MSNDPPRNCVNRLAQVIKSPSPLETHKQSYLMAGICGSILHVRRKGSAVTGERVWVSLVNADSKYQRLWGEFNARSGFMDALDAATEVSMRNHIYVPPANS